MIPFCYFDQRFYIHKCWQSAKIENKMTMIIWKIMANCGFCSCHTVDCLSTFISSLYATIAPVISVHNVLSIFTWYIGTCACLAFWQKNIFHRSKLSCNVLYEWLVECISCNHVIRQYLYSHNICKTMNDYDYYMESLTHATKMLLFR